MVRRMLSGVLRRLRGEPIPVVAADEITRDREHGLDADPGIDVAIRAAADWLCIAQDKSASADGGVARHYSLLSGWGPSYPETTGYIIPTMIAAGHHLQDPDLIARARRMAHWLVSIQLRTGAFQGGMIGQEPVVPVSFNTGQILLGLAAAVEEFGEEFRAPMERAADWLLMMQDADGSWRRSASPFAEPGEKTYYTHVAWGLLEAHRMSPTRGYAHAALLHNRWAISKQRPNGWFEKCFLVNPKYPLTHTIAYALRGLVEAHIALGHDFLLEASIRTADGLLGAMGEEGHLPGRLNAQWQSDVDWSCLTGSVQTAACWFKLHSLTGNPRYLAAAYTANAFVRRTMRLNGPIETRGAIKGSFPVDGGYNKFQYLSWANKFLIDSHLLELKARAANENVASGTPMHASVIPAMNAIALIPPPRTPDQDLTPLPADSSASLDRSLAQGVAWTAGVKWLSQLLSWPATIIVARILKPDDFGLIAMATVYIGLVSLINEFGLGIAIVRQRSLSRSAISQISGLCVLFGLGGLVFSVAAAYPLSVFYKSPALMGVMFLLSLNFVITAFKTVPLSLMQRDLQFRQSASNEALGALIQSISLVAFAWGGLGYWSLVYASLLSSGATTLMIYFQRPHPIAWPHFGQIRESITFGSHLVGSRVAWYLYTNADFFIIGRVLGKTALGNYSIGWDFATIPVEKVTALVGRVAPPIFSAVQHDHPALRRYLSRLTGGIALLTVPAGIGLAMVASDFVTLILGDEWSGAIIPLQLLAICAALRSIVPLVAQAGTIVGLSRYIMRNSIASAILMPVAFLIGANWGTIGVAAAWIVAYPIMSTMLCMRVFRAIGMTAREFFAALWPSLSSGAIMIPVVFLARHQLSDHPSPMTSLITQATAGAVAYGASLWVLHRSEVQLLVGTFKGSAA